MTTPLRVLITTDSFPPVCGGSGWSTWELVRGLASHGHHVDVVRTAVGPESRIFETHYESVRVTTFQIQAPNIPFLRNVVKNERLWQRFGGYLVDRLRSEPADILHAQHVMTTVATIRAGAIAHVPVVATVRDYWPVCYWSDLIHAPEQATLCPACTVSMMTRCVKPRAGAAALAAWPLIPYMRRNLRTKRQTLATAAAIIAVSSAIARDLVARAPALGRTPLHTIPNPLSIAALDESRGASERPLEGPYILYAGKLAPNKGVQFLLPALAKAGLRWPVVIVGDGPSRAALEAEARRLKLDVRVTGWLDREAVWAWMRHAGLLAFPSYGPESLSRVLLEAAALGVPIAAMDTGGTRDILRDGVTGLLSTTPSTFAESLAQLGADADLRARLGAAARADVRERFASDAVVSRIEQVYRSVLSRGQA